VYFKVLKSGLGLESSKLRESGRQRDGLPCAVLLAGVITGLLFLLARESKAFSETLVFAKSDCHILKRRCKLSDEQTGIKVYLYALAMLGGYLNRKAGPPPGIIVILRGMRRRRVLRQGYEMDLHQDMGN
jgi:hypothetical protein